MYVLQARLKVQNMWLMRNNYILSGHIGPFFELPSSIGVSYKYKYVLTGVTYTLCLKKAIRSKCLVKQFQVILE